MYISVKRRRKMDAREVMREMGRKGGLTRAKRMTAKERRDSAMKASRAAARARAAKKKAKGEENSKARAMCAFYDMKTKMGTGE